MEKLQENVEEIKQEELKTPVQEMLKENVPHHENHEKKVVFLALMAVGMLVWVLIWALVFKLGSEVLLVRNYTNLKDMTMMERIMGKGIGKCGSFWIQS